MDESTAVQADVTKALLNLKVRFDLTKVGHDEAQLERYIDMLRHYQLTDLTDSSYQIVYNRFKEYLFKENPDVRYSKGAGSVFGHQLPNGDWLYHNLTPTQCSQIREKFTDPEIVKLNSLRDLLFEMVHFHYFSVLVLEV